MTDNEDKINQLLNKLESILKRQDDFSREIDHLKAEISTLKSSGTLTIEKTEEIMGGRPVAETGFELKKEIISPDRAPQKEETNAPPKHAAPSVNKPTRSKIDLEKLIGENLINKIGIVITVIGVAIGAKYSIEHDLISPLTRIILGYLARAGLLGFGMKLKDKYEYYSAVLVSAAIAILYFITYAAYGFYELIPQAMAFMLMVVFTSFTVVAAISYTKQVIAHMGLVGAYAVPFLLSDGSGKIAVLFSYMAIINVGILVIAFKKYWKSLFYSSFGLTWFIYFLWYVSEYRIDEHF